ncbi:MULTISPECIES: phosphate acetyltransferase [unclassified Lentimonas]|uniref:phosphate acetyltransferase n=1 Tax=unclassified Lentimonas TaxID=2630993 RepID=UPI00132A6752|nr:MULTISPECIES: phosphate acetyltransferase [unclassified Lentimonas]CAA6677815.1 Phosphate acetyltransferase (EC [Lentimonas sp. CC4]CAA6683917.1 Phosphate acetyltransferase (EC [Lentimonas sp. CC6]CAA7076705.1 Phosphate acetyltransferase (EC [Lentimonas sp. CC4]CAA7169961.1 Phosphate acetyltransferase (EC [Lentimonas sp. CC21]CAA7181250.1 Phosphate acetyltransferase (EC [Lentimonas sp. CC8]
MKHVFFLAASGVESGLTSISLGVFRALDRRGIRVGFCKPISQESFPEGEVDPSISLVSSTTGFKPVAPMTLDEAERYVRNDQMDDLMEKIVEQVSTHADEVDVMVVEGLLPTESETFPNRINRSVVKALSAEVILVNALRSTSMEDLRESLEMSASLYGGWQRKNVIGCILNKVQVMDADTSTQTMSVHGTGNSKRPSKQMSVDELTALKEQIVSECSMFQDPDFELIGCVPWNPELPSFRVSDVARHLDAKIVNAGDFNGRRVKDVLLCARNLSQILHVFDAGRLLVAPCDRIDILLTAALATMDKIPLSGIVLTGGMELSDAVLDLCRPAFEQGLPVLSVETDSFDTATALSRMRNYIPGDDIERFNTTLDYAARHLNMEALGSRVASDLEVRMSPAAFRHQLSCRARKANKRIILPEGDEPRTIVAAASCQQRGLAQCVLIGNPDDVSRVALRQGVDLSGIEVIDPEAVRERYVPALMEMRKHKNLTEKEAREALEDTVMLGTVMLALDEVDGLVSGAVHSSASTIRPALQLIKTSPGAKVVSSVFFMCLPDQVLVYGDCAVNPDPNAESLADIAIQSAESAESFGIPARVALISYSTGQSGSGADVEKVREATAIAKAERPDLLMDGPLQYDSAAVSDVAKTKAPDSKVAGQATVFVFPDLNTGNTTYKAVQRAANVISIGPMLQGLRKPVNDLSRGALVDDIVYTIAITAIQADI